MRKVIVCGSTRYLNEMISWLQENVKDDVTHPEPRAATIEEKGELMADYLIKISETNEMIVFNGENDYIGMNTCIEIGFAMALGKPVYMSHPSKQEEIIALDLKTWDMRMRVNGGR